MARSPSGAKGARSGRRLPVPASLSRRTASPRTNIYVGTRLDTNCGIVSATLDGGAPVTFDCYYPAATTSQTRRLLFPGIAAGQHKVVITLSGNKNPSSQGWYFYFDFLDCAVASDVPDPVSTTTAVAVATDFDTDNTYKLSPQRLVWNIQKLGLLGEIDHYCGVFWWKQSVASNPSYRNAQSCSSETGTIKMSFGCTLVVRPSAKRCSAGRTAATLSPGTSPISSMPSSTVPGLRPPAAS